VAKGPKKATRERAPAEDVVLLCGRTQDGAGLDVIRKRGELVQRGVVRPLEDGKPLSGEVVKLDQRGNSPLFDVTVHCSVNEGKPVEQNDVAAALHDADGVAADRVATNGVAADRVAADRVATNGVAADRVARGRPARVATDDYRRNWDAIWKRPASKALPN
jgi:hypothetical protein